MSPGLSVTGPPVDLGVAPGERVAVVGPRRDEVTRVLAVAAGRLPGTAALDGEPLGLASAPRQVGYLSQEHRLIGTLTAVENLMVVLLAGTGGARGSGSDRSGLVERAERQLDALALPPASWHNLAEQLSGGQQQRVALGRALVAQPRLLVLDHPTSELDPDSVEVVDRALRERAAEGVCCLVASDDDLVLQGCDRRVSLAGRRARTA